ncbi:MAG: DUF4411 family protein [Cytophagales bacterium]|nr:DUF4411 family protein [Cytophagales bacterium]
MAIFVVDSNFFIQAHRFTYPLDVAKGFWGKIKKMADAGTIISIDKVKYELYNKNDHLEKWCKANLPKDFFKDTSKVISEYGRVSAWAISKNGHYLTKAINEFLDADEADAFLIAYCLADPKSRFIVTYETGAPQKTSKIKIPDCCDALNVKYMNTIEMFRELNETF